MELRAYYVWRLSTCSWIEFRFPMDYVRQRRVDVGGPCVSQPGLAAAMLDQAERGQSMAIEKSALSKTK